MRWLDVHGRVADIWVLVFRLPSNDEVNEAQEGRGVYDGHPPVQVCVLHLEQRAYKKVVVSDLLPSPVPEETGYWEKMHNQQH